MVAIRCCCKNEQEALRTLGFWTAQAAATAAEKAKQAAAKAKATIEAPIHQAMAKTSAQAKVKTSADAEMRHCPDGGRS